MAVWRRLTETGASTALDAFEPLHFANLVVVLEGSFVHRTRGLEKKDGNPLNEVRMLSQSILANGGVLAEDKSIKYQPEKSVLKLRLGDRIVVKEADFAALSKAFFADIEAKYSE